MTKALTSGKEMNTENLWPEDFGKIDVIPPVAILRQQATLLGQRTQNILEGEVSTIRLGNGRIVHKFYLKAIALGYYKYQLFSAEHNVVPLYPVELTSSEYVYQVRDEQMLSETLRLVFTSERTKDVIQSLIAQSLAEPEFTNHLSE